MTAIFPYWKKYYKEILLAFFFLFAGVILDLTLPTIVSRMIDQGVMVGDMDVVLRLGLIMLLVTALSAVSAIFRCIISSIVSQKFGADIRRDMFTKINKFSFETLGKQETAGLITRMTNDTSQLVAFTNSLMRIFLRAPSILVGAIIMTLLLNVRLALILLAVVPIITLLMVISLKVTLPMFAKMQTALDKNNGVIREYLSGVRVVKAYNTFAQEVERFGDSNTDLADISIRSQRRVGIFFPIISFVVNLGLVITLWFARGWIDDSTMQVGQLVAFLNYMMQISMAIGMIFRVYQMFIRAKASAVRVGEVLEEDVAEALGQVEAVPAGEYDIVFDQVTFTYPGSSTPALTDISFTLPAGEKLAIIGSTGSGKTSLVQLVPAFYKPDQGRVLVAGKDTTTVDDNRLRSQVAISAQESTIFYGTVADNIRMGKAGATMDEITAAAKAADAYDFIAAMADGFDTVVGQRGVTLSGGQKQRISIARALVRKAPILVLDDSLSAVDTTTEASIMAAIDHLSPAPTTIIITQRIATVTHLPYILVLDQGRVAGFGNHGQLLATCQIYQELHALQ